MKITSNFVYFWGGILSNFYPCSFVMDNITFTSSEQAFMYKKAITFKDNEVAEKILKSTTPKEAKRLGRLVNNYDDQIWNAKRMQIMYECCLAKFSQNEDLKSFIAAADFNNKHFVEASPFDTIWGIGVDEQHALDDKSNWKGLNCLGQVLDKVRKAIIKTTK